MSSDIPPVHQPPQLPNHLNDVQSDQVGNSSPPNTPPPVDGQAGMCGSWPNSPYRYTSYGNATYSDAMWRQEVQKHATRNRYTLLSLLLLTLLAVCSPFIARQVVYSVTRGREQARAEAARKYLQDLPDGISRIQLAAKAIRPSVVGIEVIQVREAPQDEFSLFFGHRRSSPEIGMGQGSGVIIDADGYVLTNNHVIRGATKVAVRLYDGTSRDARLVGADPKTDVAVLKIDSSGLLAASWGSSDELEVGQQVLAVGSPYGLDQTVTEGIISAKERRGLLDDLVFQDFLQTDAAINPGNSGGPLVNLKGEVVGINTMIIGEGFQGIGFAIPSKLVQKRYEQIRNGEPIMTGYLGVVLEEASSETLEQLGFGQNTQGVLIRRVERRSPADQAGLQPGELLVEWDGEPVKGVNDLRYRIAGSSPGAKIPVVLRDANGTQSKKVIQIGSDS